MKRRVIIHLSIVIFLYLILRIPLLGKTLGADEIFNTFCYLQQRPFANYHSEQIVTEPRPWAADWQREIAYHPPFLNIFYYNWIRIFGDSEISLHAPTLIAGLIGIIILYLFGRLVFNGEVSFIATLATVCSSSHIMYSTQAVHAIFEMFFFLGSLLLLFEFIIKKNQTAFYLLLILNVLSIVVFYHYLFFLVVQTIILFVLRKELKIKMSYFILVSLLIALFLFFIVSRHKEGLYSRPFWRKNNLIQAIIIIVSMPDKYSL